MRAIGRVFVAAAIVTLQVLCSALVAVAVSGCQTTSQSEMVILPKLPAIANPAALRTFDGVQVLIECHKLAPGAIVDLTDGKFVEVEHEWLEAAVEWAVVVAASRKIEGVAESNDCDNISKAFSVIADISTARAGIKAQALAARIYVTQAKEFGGIPAGGAHALNAFRSNRGYFVLEPQVTRARRRLVPISEYPNREMIFRLKIGG